MEEKPETRGDQVKGWEWNRELSRKRYGDQRTAPNLAMQDGQPRGLENIKSPLTL